MDRIGSTHLMEPVGEERLFGALAHARYGEVVFLTGDELNSVLVDGADFAECCLDTSVRIVGATKYQAGGTQRQLA